MPNEPMPDIIYAYPGSLIYSEEEREGTVKYHLSPNQEDLAENGNTSRENIFEAYTLNAIRDCEKAEAGLAEALELLDINEPFIKMLEGKIEELNLQTEREKNLTTVLMEVIKTYQAPRR